MANPEVLAVLMVIAVVAALMAGYPVALTLAGTSLIFAVLGDAIGAMSFDILGALPQRIFGVMREEGRDFWQWGAGEGRRNAR